MKPTDDRKRLRRLVADSPALVDALNDLFPAAPPRLEDSDREVWFKAGQRSVVAFLLTLRAEHTERGKLLED